MAERLAAVQARTVTLLEAESLPPLAAELQGEFTVVAPPGFAVAAVLVVRPDDPQQPPLRPRETDPVRRSASEERGMLGRGSHGRGPGRSPRRMRV